MRTVLFVFLFLISHVLLAQPYSSFIKDLPTPIRVVNDYGNFLTSYQENNLEDKLISYRRRTGNAIVIITLSTLTDRTGTTWSVEETALQYFNKWGIGGSYSNKGILLLVSQRPRRVRITTGIGIERYLTDYDCQRIIDETIVPSFKSGMFYTGLKEGVNDIVNVLGSARPGRLRNGMQENNRTQAAVAPQPQTQPQPSPQQETMTYGPDNVEEDSSTLRLVIWGIILFVVAVWLRIRYVRKKSDAETYSADGSTGNSSENINPVAEFFIAIAWVLWGVIKIAFGVFILVFTFFGRRSRGAGRSSGASESFGGGRSYGGGASGSW